MMTEILKILCIDDTQDQFLLVQGYLDNIQSSRTAYDVEWAPTYTSALNMLAETDYDVCLVDLQLGHRNGLDLMRDIRRTNLDIPMILMTGHGTHAVDLKAMELGAADYIDKAELTGPALERSLRYAVEQARALTALRQAEQSIRESETRFRALVEKGSDYVLLVDERGVIHYASPSFEHKLGYVDTDMAGNSVQNLILDEDVEIMELTLDALLDSPNEVTSNQLRIQHRDGSWRWVEVTGTNLMDEAGVEGIVLNAHDITAHKEAREAEYQQRMLAEALLDSAAALNSILEFDKVLKQILAIVGRVVPHDTACIMLLEEGRTRTVGVYGYDDPQIEAEIHRARYAVNEIPILRQVLSKGEILIVPTLDAEDHDTPVTHNLQSIIGVPVMYGDKVIAFLSLGSYRAGFFGQEQSRPLQALAHQAAIAIQNARAFEQAQEMAALEQRQALARDLHDAVSQTLFSASVIAEALPRLWALDPEDAERDTLQLARLTKGALAEMRTLLLELRPTTLIETDFSILVKHLIGAAASRTDSDTQIELIATGPEIRLPPDVQVALYRIVQEVLNNIVKHAHAEHVEVRIDRQPDQIRITVRDDGRGFDVSNALTTGRMGLVIIRERAASINASIDVVSETDGDLSGTTILIGWNKNGLH